MSTCEKLGLFRGDDHVERRLPTPRIAIRTRLRAPDGTALADIPITAAASIVGGNSRTSQRIGHSPATDPE
ncbi:MAG: hypothetical protein M1833_003980 [Piccolia ochrophora]|nr:MAG: hypothetical protein M1833_003980 [Piccolia ochrophora]